MKENILEKMKKNGEKISQLEHLLSEYVQGNMKGKASKNKTE